MNSNIKKFYAGAKHIGEAIFLGTNADCTRNNEYEAIQDAQKMLDENKTLNCVAIVKIVILVKRERSLVIVEPVE